MYGDWTSGPDGDGIHLLEKDIPVTEHTNRNGSLFLHAYLTRFGKSPDPKADNYCGKMLSYVSTQLNKFKRKKVLMG